MVLESDRVGDCRGRRRRRWGLGGERAAALSFASFVKPYHPYTLSTPNPPSSSQTRHLLGRSPLSPPPQPHISAALFEVSGSGAILEELREESELEASSIIPTGAWTRFFRFHRDSYTLA
ncbi:hypothetical protein Salat_1350500 [Sesamum alatum]|uniref:Uncharacterized protein n=1 Tax=Sesamum alatum TaxID=300844 RepID=A0AAE1YJ73_9LAMI|nr:hypothetical protein Salat_1350500 [Sesamum alatum]